MANVYESVSADRLEHNFQFDNNVNFFDGMEIIKSSMKDPEQDGSVWMKIKKPELVELIVQTYVDPIKKKILSTVSSEPTTIPQIINVCNIPTTLGYRSINFLIKSGMLKPAGYSIINNKKIMNYRTIFEDVIIRLDKEKITVKAKFKNRT